MNFWVALGVFVGSVACFIWWQFVRTPSEKPPKPEVEAPCRAEGADAWPSRVGASGSAGYRGRMIVRELELDLDAFEGPFDLLLTLVLKDELDLRELDVAGIVLAFLERLVEREDSISRPAASSSS